MEKLPDAPRRAFPVWDDIHYLIYSIDAIYIHTYAQSVLGFE
jgi:hypothetical protein